MFNDGIIPASSSEIGKVLVCIHTRAKQFKYPAVMKRHIDKDIAWFLHRKEYSPMEMIKGMRVELDYIESDEGVAYRCNNNPYPMAIRLAEDIMVERYDIIDYPELYI